MPSLMFNSKSQSEIDRENASKALISSAVADKKKVDTALAKERQSNVNKALGEFKQRVDQMRTMSPISLDRSQFVIDTTQTDASRQQQLAALAMMQQAAQGGAPSAAQMQMQAGMDQAVRNQMAMAASARGGFNPAALRAAQLQGAGMSQQAVQQGAVLRAQEMADARNQYMAGTNQLRGMDAQAAQAQAAMYSQGALQNAAYQAQHRDTYNQLLGQYMGGVLGYDQAQMQALAQQRALQQQKDLADAQANRQILGGILSGAGAIAGAYFGGPAGAAAGASVGRSIGGA